MTRDADSHRRSSPTPTLLLALVLPLLVVGLLACSPAQALPVPTQPVHYESFAVPNTSVTLQVAVAGSCRATGSCNTTVLLLHGFPESSLSWMGLVDPLLADGRAASWQLVIPDQRGYNNSDKPPPTAAANYDFTRLVDDAAALATHYGGGGPVYVLSHDWGGVVNWGLAWRFPQLVRAQVVINAPHPSVFLRLLTSDAEQQKRSAYILQFDDPSFKLNALELAASFQADVWFHGNRTEERFIEAWAKHNAIACQLAWYRVNVCGGCREFSAATLAKTRMPANATIDGVPTLVLWGMQDSAFDNQRNLAGLAEFVVGAPLHIVTAPFANASHWVAQEQPFEVAAQALAFWDALE